MIDLNATPIAIPSIKGQRKVVRYIGTRKETPQEFFTHVHRDVKGRQLAKTGPEYWNMLSKWFFNGLRHLKFNVKTGAVDNEDLMLQFVGTVLQSWEPQHEHKVAFLCYFLTKTCESVEWEV